MYPRISILLLITACVPAFADTGVVLFGEKRFRGPGELLQHDDPDLRDNRIGNDRLRSLRIPPHCTVTLFEHTGYRGRSVVLRDSTANLGRTALGNDRASSIRITWSRPGPRLPAPPSPPTRLPRAGVILYPHVGFGGQEIHIDGDCPNLRDTPLGNDRLSSLRVPRGYEVILYEHTGYRGRWESLTADDANLCDNRIGNDTVSSLRIRRIEGHGRPNRGRNNHRDRHERYDDAAVLYEHPGFQGRHVAVTEALADLNQGPVGNNHASSVRVPPGYAVTLYAGSRFTGASETFYNSDRDLSDNWIGDNRVNSVRVVYLGRTRYEAADERGGRRHR